MSGFIMSRPARKRGKEVKKRGISNEQVCVATAIDRNGIYHINHINSLHSGFKEWMYKFYGVSTKFLANYLHGFKWLQYFSEDKEIVKSKNILVHSTTSIVDTTILSYRGSEPIYA